MLKDERYDTIRPMFIRQQLQTFGDIFKVVPKSVVAIALGKEKGRFNELVEAPGNFTILEIIMLDKLCNLTLPEMAVLLEPECPKDKNHDNEKKAFGYRAVRVMFEEQKVNLFEDIFKHIRKSRVAEDIGKKRGRFKHLMEHIEDFFVKDIVRIGQLCELTLPEMFNLVESQYAKQNKNSK